MYLIDTDVLSALRRRERHPEAAAWLANQRTTDLYLSAVTIGEIERGIAQQQPRDPAFARDLTVWLDRILAWYADRILPIDVPTARRWGHLSGALGHESVDLLIAATALQHGLTVVTRNTTHFTPTRVPALNPFNSQEMTSANEPSDIPRQSMLTRDHIDSTWARSAPTRSDCT